MQSKVVPPWPSLNRRWQCSSNESTIQPNIRTSPPAVTRATSQVHSPLLCAASQCHRHTEQLQASGSRCHLYYVPLLCIWQRNHDSSRLNVV
jgi:hypothetical protein